MSLYPVVGDRVRVMVEVKGRVREAWGEVVGAVQMSTGSHYYTVKCTYSATCTVEGRHILDVQRKPLQETLDV